jgi:hypothetical protein
MSLSAGSVRLKRAEDSGSEHELGIPTWILRVVEWLIFRGPL